MSADLGWGRETFALAIALQNLVWGLTQPFAGRLADRHGAGWIVFGGAVLYVAGLYMMSLSQTEVGFFVCGFQVVFLFHQIGAFLGGWLGGYLYDIAGLTRPLAETR